MQYKHYYLCLCVSVHAYEPNWLCTAFKLCACTCMSMRSTWIYVNLCVPKCVSVHDCACAIPPAGTIITACAHSRQLFPRGPWLRPAWRDAAWLTVEPGSLSPPPTHTHTHTCMWNKYECINKRRVVRAIHTCCYRIQNKLCAFSRGDKGSLKYMRGPQLYNHRNKNIPPVSRSVQVILYFLKKLPGNV